ncbi:hypothetical protein PVK06_044004 [Gossypium arboreum]|uniref:Reverse transcriptase Ty1/copia-type domain-containing protein n=1 Tax=Gossypium arboreum TaxID=29729 RepID=A0ABR0MPY2_GOSAR|nr:hypothetical protein PVK06_044004 [Gossypium arboreum]
MGMDGMLEDVTVSQRLIGRLLYFTHTRLDITFAIQHLSQFMQAPKKVHYEAALQIVRYVRQHPGKGIFLLASSKPVLNAYCDSDWASCLMTCRSVTGYCIKLGDSLICWKSKKQNTVSRSSAEAENGCMASIIAKLLVNY